MSDDSIDFDTVKEEISKISEFHTFQILKRSSKWSAHDQIPVVFILTDECIYYGGVESLSRKFSRIYIKDIIDVKITGPLFFRAIEIKFMLKEKKKNIYFCPFTGPTEKPLMDVEQMNELKELLSRYINKKL